MSLADGKHEGNPEDAVTTHLRFKNGVGVITLAGALTLTRQYRNFLKIDPGGAHRDVTLPDEENGLLFFIYNAADAAENLVVKNDAAATLATLGQGEACFFVCEAAWHALGPLATG